MTDDIVDRLRSPEVFIDTGGLTSPVAYEAAAEIERLRAEMRRRGKEMIRKRSTIANIVYGMEDEGDRVFFGSTNDADQLRALSECLDDFALRQEEVNAIDWPKLATERYAEVERLRADNARLQTAVNSIASQKNYAEHGEYELRGASFEDAFYTCVDVARKAALFHLRTAMGGTAMEISDEMVKAAHAAHAQTMWNGGTSDDCMRAALEAVAPAIRAAAMEEAVQTAIDMGCAESVDSDEINVAQRAAHRRDMAFEVASALETKAAAIRAAKETA